MERLGIAIMMRNYLQMDGSDGCINQMSVSQVVLFCFDVLQGAKQDLSC